MTTFIRAAIAALCVCAPMSALAQNASDPQTNDTSAARLRALVNPESQPGLHAVATMDERNAAVLARMRTAQTQLAIVATAYRVVSTRACALLIARESPVVATCQTVSLLIGGIENERRAFAEALDSAVRDQNAPRVRIERIPALLDALRSATLTMALFGRQTEALIEALAPREQVAVYRDDVDGERLLAATNAFIAAVRPLITPQ